jgi:hypothetical protein
MFNTTNTSTNPHEETAMEYLGLNTDYEIEASACTGDALPSDLANETPDCVIDVNVVKH